MDAPERWFVGFIEAEVPWWLRLLTRPNFRHVVALRYDHRFDVWIFIEWSSRRLFVENYKGEEIDPVLAKLRAEGGMLALDVTTRTNFAPRAPLYCVSWTKQLLGISAPWVLTPWQLACELRRRGAGVIFEPSCKENANGRIFERTETASGPSSRPGTGTIA